MAGAGHRHGDVREEGDRDRARDAPGDPREDTGLRQRGGRRLRGAHRPAARARQRPAGAGIHLHRARQPRHQRLRHPRRLCLHQPWPARLPAVRGRARRRARARDRPHHRAPRLAPGRDGQDQLGGLARARRAGRDRHRQRRGRRRRAGRGLQRGHRDGARLRPRHGARGRPRGREIHAPQRLRPAGDDRGARRAEGAGELRAVAGEGGGSQARGVPRRILHAPAQRRAAEGSDRGRRRDESRCAARASMRTSSAASPRA